MTLPGEAKCEWQQSVDVDSQLTMDWAFASDVLAALGHPVRLAVLREVLGGIHTVADLGTVDGFGTSGQLYHHLRLLVAAGWLRSAGRGPSSTRSRAELGHNPARAGSGCIRRTA